MGDVVVLVTEIPSDNFLRSPFYSNGDRAAAEVSTFGTNVERDPPAGGVAWLRRKEASDGLHSLFGDWWLRPDHRSQIAVLSCRFIERNAIYDEIEKEPFGLEGDSLCRIATAGASPFNQSQPR